MNKKLFKRLLIASGLIAPVAMITPMILTSCNNSTNVGEVDPNGISLGEFNKFLKVTNSKMVANAKSLWLDLIDFHGDDFHDAENLNKFYNNLVKDKASLINTLVNTNGYQPKNATSTKVDIGNINVDEYVLEKNTFTVDDATKLLAFFKNLHFTNTHEVVIGGIGEPNSEDGMGVTIKGEDIDLQSLIENDKIEVKSKITFIDKSYPTVSSGEVLTSDIEKSYNYEIIFSIKPKGDFYWKGIKENDPRYKMPLEIRLSDYVDNISFIDGLDQFKNENNAISFSGTSNEIDLSTINNVTSVDTLVTEIKKVIGLTTTDDTKENPCKYDENINFNFIFDNFSTNDTNKITGISSNADNTNQVELTKANIKLDNLKESFKKGRVLIKAMVKKDTSPNDKNVVINLIVSLKGRGTNEANKDFYWLNTIANQHKDVADVKFALTLKTK